uniref:hypothetical protein n=1 Tax=Ascidiimonas aurantiaca TaxID=1685432 RepID=UPI0030EDAD5B
NWPSGGDSQDGSLGNSGGSGGGGSNGDTGNGGDNPGDGQADCIADGNGNCIGDVTTPVLLLNDAALVSVRLNITNSARADWLFNHLEVASRIYRFLAIHNFSAEAKAEALMHIDAERANDNGWTPKTGTFANRKALEYIAVYQPAWGETMYLLKSGRILYRSATKRAINKADAGTLASTEPPMDGYNYIRSTEQEEPEPRWYEFRMPRPDYPDTDLTFLFEAFWTGVKLAGRYAVPIEDAMVLIDGKDFDGVSQSKAVAGIFILVDVVPGGKLLRITRKAGYALSAVPLVKVSLDAVSRTQRRIVKQFENSIQTASNARKGNFAEMRVDLDFVEKGYEALHVNRKANIDAAGHTGIDHIFRNPETGEFIIVEAKYHGTGGLNPGNPATDLARQMSKRWISDGSEVFGRDRLWKALDGNAALYHQIKDNYTPVVGYVQANGTINYKFVDIDGYEISREFVQ